MVEEVVVRRNVLEVEEGKTCGMVGAVTMMGVEVSYRRMEVGVKEMVVASNG